MRKLSVFNAVSLDGYFTGPGGDLSWAHHDPGDDEWNGFTAENAGGDGMLLFGRVTYEMMAGFWPTPMATASMPEVAAGMNRMPKIVFSTTMTNATWQNTRLVKSDPVGELRRLKNEPGPDMVILGSGTIIAPLAQAGLIDAYQLAVCPVALGSGRSMFQGVAPPVRLIQKKQRGFRNGNVVLWYERTP